MNKFNVDDWDVEVELETGYDDFVYGNYVDWDKFREENEEILLESFGIALPWGEEISLSEFCNIMRQKLFLNTDVLDCFKLDRIKFVKHDDDFSNIIIQFPQRNTESSKIFISEVLDYFEVPNGIKYEKELPNSLQYWNQMHDGEYYSYKNYPLQFENYLTTISEIESKVKNTFDSLTKKSLIFSSFVISESLLKSVIVNNIPEDNNISDFSKKILSDEIDRSLCSNVEKRNKLFKQLFNQKAPAQDWINIRNSLAHDIESSRIENNCIIFTDLKYKKECIISINTLFIQQKEFCKELVKIIDLYNRNIVVIQ